MAAAPPRLLGPRFPTPRFPGERRDPGTTELWMAAKRHRATAASAVRSAGGETKRQHGGKHRKNAGEPEKREGGDLALSRYRLPRREPGGASAWVQVAVSKRRRVQRTVGRA